MRTLTLVFICTSIFAMHSFAMATDNKTKDLPVVYISGTVGVSGSSPNIKPVLVAADKSFTYEVTGYFRPEFMALSGLRVEVTARIIRPSIDPALLPQMEVLTYEILEISQGIKPWLGVIVKKEDRFFIHVVGMPKDIELTATGMLADLLTANIGSKVWLTGKMNKKHQLKPSKIQVIRKAEAIETINESKKH